MVMKILRRSTRRPCGKSTSIFLEILKKNECIFVYKCGRLHFENWSSWSHISENYCLICARSLEGKWYNLKEYGIEKRVHFLGLCRLQGMGECWLELLQEL